MNQKIYQADEVIFDQGSFARTMYQIEAGAVGILASHHSANKQLLATLGPGDFFGEMGLVECYPRSATAVALADGTVVDELDADDFADFYRNDPDKVLSIMRQLSSRLRETDRQYQEACRTIYEAIEAERAERRRSSALSAALTGMLRRLTGANEAG